MIRNIAFVESLAECERRGARQEWREALAGLLVLRLCDLSMLEPRLGRRSGRTALAMRQLVARVSRASAVHDPLWALVEALGGPVTSSEREVVVSLRAYALALEATGRGRLARDVWDAIGRRALIAR